MTILEHVVCGAVNITQTILLFSLVRPLKLGGQNNRNVCPYNAIQLYPYKPQPPNHNLQEMLNAITILLLLDLDVKLKNICFHQ